MKAFDIAMVVLGAPVVLGVMGWIVHFLVDETDGELWPRGLRWFPRTWLGTGERLHRTVLRIFWPERLPSFKGREVLRLEALDREWRTWAGSSDGEVPLWDPERFRGRGAWRPRVRPPQLCPCGYTDECAMHCGTGHLDGRCPVHNPEPTALPGPGVRYDR